MKTCANTIFTPLATIKFAQNFTCMLSHKVWYKLFSHLIQMFIQINEGLLYAFKFCNFKMETISMKTLMFLLLKLFVVNARYRSDINTNIISHGELLYFIAKILGTRNDCRHIIPKMQFILLFPLSYFSLSYFDTDNVKHQSYKYWKPEKGIASRTFPSAHFSQVSMATIISCP